MRAQRVANPAWQRRPQPEPSVARVAGNREREAYTGSEQAASLSLESDTSWVPTLFQ